MRVCILSVFLNYMNLISTIDDMYTGQVIVAVYCLELFGKGVFLTVFFFLLLGTGQMKLKSPGETDIYFIRFFLNKQINK